MIWYDHLLRHLKIGFTFLLRLTQVVLEKRPLNRCNSNSSSSKHRLLDYAIKMAIWKLIYRDDWSDPILSSNIHLQKWLNDFWVIKILYGILMFYAVVTKNKGCYCVRCLIGDLQRVGISGEESWHIESEPVRRHETVWECFCVGVIHSRASRHWIFYCRQVIWYDMIWSSLASFKDWFYLFVATHTHTRLTTLCPGLPGWAGTRKVKPIWILLKQVWQWHQLGRMQVCTSLYR